MDLTKLLLAMTQAATGLNAATAVAAGLVELAKQVKATTGNIDDRTALDAAIKELDAANTAAHDRIQAG